MKFIHAMNFRTLDLNLLRVLEALLAEGSVTRAAERIGLSQPAVSAALARLRSALGDPLLVRQGQGLVPTEYARRIAPDLRQALDGLASLLSGPSDFDPSNATETFRISGSDFFAELLMPGLARRIGPEAPGVRIQHVDLVPENYLSDLEGRTADLALIPTTDFPDWIEHRPLFRSTFRVIARAGHPDLPGPGGEIPLGVFCALPHVVFSPEGRLSSIGDAALERLGKTRRVTMTLATFYGVARAVAASEAVALVPGQFARAVGPVLGLADYPAPLPVAVPVISMVWHRRSSLDPAHRWLRDIIVETLAPLNAGEAPLD
jgi:DNA-binding transcriptional LysR family regulator